jgi:hypothetical protein
MRFSIDAKRHRYGVWGGRMGTFGQGHVTRHWLLGR